MCFHEHLQSLFESVGWSACAVQFQLGLGELLKPFHVLGHQPGLVRQVQLGFVELLYGYAVRPAPLKEFPLQAVKCVLVGSKTGFFHLVNNCTVPHRLKQGFSLLNSGDGLDVWVLEKFSQSQFNLWRWNAREVAQSKLLEVVEKFAANERFSVDGEARLSVDHCDPSPCGLVAEEPGGALLVREDLSIDVLEVLFAYVGPPEHHSFSAVTL